MKWFYKPENSDDYLASMEPPKKAFVAMERAAPQVLQSQWKLVCRNTSAVDIFKALPIPAAILNSHRQILFANAAFAQFTECRPEAVIGKRPGEAWSCVHFKSKRAGCGAGVACRTCDAALAIQNSDESAPYRECRIEREGADGSVCVVDFRLCARPLEIENQQFNLLTVADITTEKQRYALERIFYHDLLNTATGMQGLAGLMADAQDAHPEIRSMAQWISCVAGQLNDTVNAQRMLSSAYSNTLTLSPQTVDLRSLLAQIVQFYASHDLTRGCPIRVLPKGLPSLKTDPAILRRVLLNLLKAAVEDSQKGQPITFDVTSERDCVRISVHSPVVLEGDVKSQFLCRSVLRGTNRELITYTALMLTERCLGGRLAVESAAPGGTILSVILPLKWWNSAKTK